MVEFALILPLLIVLAFGISELGRALYQQNSLTRAMASGVRNLARSWDTVDENCTVLTGWNSAVARAKNLTIYGNELGEGRPVVEDLSLDQVVFNVTEKNNGSTGGSACVVDGSVQTPFNGVFGDQVVPLLNLGAITLNARSEERYVGE